MDDGKHRHFRLMLDLTFNEPLTGQQLADRIKQAIDALPAGKTDWYFNATDAPIPDGFANPIFGADHLRIGRS